MNGTNPASSPSMTGQYSSATTPMPGQFNLHNVAPEDQAQTPDVFHDRRPQMPNSSWYTSASANNNVPMTGEPPTGAGV